METISKKLEYELSWLFKAYRDGSTGSLYYPEADDDSPPKKALIRAKRLTKIGYAKELPSCTGHPVYTITTEGIQYALTRKLPEREPLFIPRRRRRA